MKANKKEKLEISVAKLNKPKILAKKNHQMLFSVHVLH